MKRLLVIFALFLVAACADDVVETPAKGGGAVISGDSRRAARGTLAVKLSPAVAESISDAVRLDEIAGFGDAFAELEVVHAERVVAFNPEWEHCYEATGLNRWYAIYFDDEVEPAAVARRMAAVEGVECVEMPLSAEARRLQRVGRMRPFTASGVSADTRGGVVMNDPLLASQWHFENVGPTDDAPNRREGADVNVVDAWSLSTGDPRIVVAVLDEPLYLDHPDLKPNLWCDPENPSVHGYYFFNKKEELDWRSSYYDSDYQEYLYADHGSHVAGVIAARNNNLQGVCGIAGGGVNGDGVRLMSCQIMGYDESTYDPYAEVKAFAYALEHGAIIAQNSWGYNFDYDYTPEDLIRDWEDGADPHFDMLKNAIETFTLYAGSNDPTLPLDGGLVIFAAGNDGDLFGDVKVYPAAESGAVAVAATTWSDLPTYYTNYGTWVDISAPGGSAAGEAAILSTILCDPSMQYDDGRPTSGTSCGYGYMQGTSMAAPHVAGVAALGLSYAAQLGKRYTVDEFKAMLLSSVRGIDHHMTGNRSGINLADYRGKMGGGCVDALKLLLAIKGSPSVRVEVGKSVAAGVKRFFGGEGSAVTLKSVRVLTSSDDDFWAAEPRIMGGALILQCARAGMAFVEVTALVGDTTIVRELAVVARQEVADNGGWM